MKDGDIKENIFLFKKKTAHSISITVLFKSTLSSSLSDSSIKLVLLSIEGWEKTSDIGCILTISLMITSPLPLFFAVVPTIITSRMLEKQYFIFWSTSRIHLPPQNWKISDSSIINIKFSVGLY